MVVPNALQVIKMAPGRRFCVLGRLSEEVGWPHSDLIKRLEVRQSAETEKHIQYSRPSTVTLLCHVWIVANVNRTKCHLCRVWGQCGKTVKLNALLSVVGMYRMYMMDIL